MAKIDSAYDYYMSVYGDQVTSRYDSHKKSDLRKVYNHIVKSTKESPLYKITDADSAKRAAIDIKENAHAIQNVVASLSDNYGEFDDSFQKRVAVSSNPDQVSVEYVGDGKEKNVTDAFEVEVARLAGPQVNTGNFLKDSALSFASGSYTFDLSTTTSAYEFQFNVSTAETNSSVLAKLSNLFNGSNLGVVSEVISDGDGSSALQLTSTQTGLAPGENYLFSISPGTGADNLAAMDLLGIGQVSQPSTNSEFYLNGTKQESLSNKFTVNNAFELTLHAPTEEGEATTISFKPNTEAIADNVQELVDAFNGILDLADKYSVDDASTGKSGAKGRMLAHDMSSVSLNRKIYLEEIGLMVADDGRLSIDQEKLADAVSDERAEDTFDRLSKFKDAIGMKADSAAIDPMHYVDKVVVEYKNPGKSFSAPYVSSIYSGMMLDSYI